jgi:hypothetical protein
MSFRGDLQTLEELITRVELEPTMKDLYVEGPGDVAIMEAVLAHAGIKAKVYAVKERLDIRRDQVEEYSEDYGNRSLLVTAAAVLETRLGVAQTSVLCVIDSDWAHVIGPMPLRRSCLEMTDLPSIEHYFLAPSAFRRFLKQGLQRPDAEPEKVKDLLTGGLLDIAAARIALENVNVACLDQPFSLANFKKKPSAANGREIIKRSVERLPAPSRPTTWQKIADNLSVYRQWLEAQEHLGRGHDIAPAIITAFNLKGDLAKPSVIEALMRTTARADELINEPFFRRVVARMAA